MPNVKMRHRNRHFYPWVLICDRPTERDGTNNGSGTSDGKRRTDGGREREREKERANEGREKETSHLLPSHLSLAIEPSHSCQGYHKDISKSSRNE